MADARLGRLFGRRIENDLWRAVVLDGPARLPEYARYNKLLTSAACTLRSGQSRGQSLGAGGEPKTFWQHPSLHPHIADPRRLASVR